MTETDQSLWNDPLWVAIQSCIERLEDDPRKVLFEKHPTMKRDWTATQSTSYRTYWFSVSVLMATQEPWEVIKSNRQKYTGYRVTRISESIRPCVWVPL